MNEDVFLKRSFKPFMAIDLIHESEVIECILIKIDFDERLLKLRILPNNIIHEDDIWVRCEHCEFSRPKLKQVK